MKRKLIKQGGGNGLTIYIPKKWVDSQGLTSGDEVDIVEEKNKLILSPEKLKKEIKKIEINIEKGSFNIFRSLIGGLYRGGYDQITVRFSERGMIKDLMKAVDSLIGCEVFDIEEKKCTIRNIYNEDLAEIRQYVLKSIHTIKTMIQVIEEDMEKKEFNSGEEIFEYRNNVLKYRDVISRLIMKNKLLDNKNFPNLIISFNLWNIARFYYRIYKELDKNFSDKEIFAKLNHFFDDYFLLYKKGKLDDRYEKYDELMSEFTASMRKNGSLINAYCISILALIQSCNSSMFLLNF